MLRKSIIIFLTLVISFSIIFTGCYTEKDYSTLMKKAKFYEKHNEDSAFTLYNQILSETKNSLTKGEILYRLGYINFYHDKYESSIKYFDKAEAKLLKVKNNKSYNILKKVYLYSGDAYRAQGKMPEAIVVLNKNIEIANTQKDSSLLAETINKIGRVYFKNQMYEKSLEYCNKALNIAKSINDSTKVQKCLGNIAVVYGEQMKFDKAIPIFLEEREYFRNLNNMNKVADVNINVGMCYMYSGNLDKGIEYILEANEYYKQNNKISGISFTYRNLAYYYEMKGDYENSIKNYIKARDICRKNNVKQVLENVLCRMSHLSEKYNKFKDAHLYFKEYYKYKDSLEIEKSKTEVSNLELKYKQDRKIDKIKQKEKISRILIIMSSVIIILILTIIIITVRKRLVSHKEKLKHEKEKKQLMKVEIENAELKQKQLDSELTRKRQEILDFSFHIQDKNRLLEDMEQELVLLKNNHKIDVAGMTSIRNSLKSHLQRNIEFTELNDKLQNINAEYFDIIKEKHPDVTKYELNLIGLIKLNISTKQISVIYSTTEKSIESRRYRLRKKLKLTNKENLSEYLNNIISII